MTAQQQRWIGGGLAAALVLGGAVGWTLRPTLKLPPELIHPQSPKFIAAKILASCNGEADCRRCSNCSECEYCRTAVVKCGRYPRPAAPPPGLAERLDKIVN